MIFGINSIESIFVMDNYYMITRVFSKIFISSNSSFKAKKISIIKRFPLKLPTIQIPINLTRLSLKLQSYLPSISIRNNQNLHQTQRVVICLCVRRIKRLHSSLRTAEIYRHTGDTIKTKILNALSQLRL